MKRKILFGACVFVLSFFSFNVLASQDVFPVSFMQSTTKDLSCPATPNYADPDFCSTFPAVAVCQCKITAPPSICTSAHAAYNMMMKILKSVHAGCEYAVTHNVIPASDEGACEDRWNCYINAKTTDDHQCGNEAPCPGNGAV